MTDPATYLLLLTKHSTNSHQIPKTMNTAHSSYSLPTQQQQTVVPTPHLPGYDCFKSSVQCCSCSPHPSCFAAVFVQIESPLNFVSEMYTLISFWLVVWFVTLKLNLGAHVLIAWKLSFSYSDHFPFLTIRVVFFSPPILWCSCTGQSTARGISQIWLQLTKQSVKV